MYVEYKGITNYCNQMCESLRHLHIKIIILPRHYIIANAGKVLMNLEMHISFLETGNKVQTMQTN